MPDQADVRPRTLSPAAATIAAGASTAVIARPPAQLERRSRAQTRVRWELLRNLVRKDLKVKYQGSTLGFAWSLANPLLLLAVYTFVFQIVIKNAINDFAIYLMSGLLIWNAFNGSVSSACGSVVFNANLVKKVRFPLPVLPLSAVGFALVHFVLQLGVLFAVCAAVQYNIIGLQLFLLIPAFGVAMIFIIALSMLVSALNVRYRDTAHIVDVAMIAWFWLNPIVYPAGLISDRLGRWTWVYYLNPMASICATFQRAIYNNPYQRDGKLALPSPGIWWYLRELSVAAGISLALLWVGVTVFRRMQADFAEDL